MPAPQTLRFEPNLFDQSCCMSEFEARCRVFCKLSLKYAFLYEIKPVILLQIEGNLRKRIFVAACLEEGRVKWLKVPEAADFHQVQLIRNMQHKFFSY